MNQPTKELKKELLPSLKKGLQRIAANEDPVFKYAMSLKERDASLTDEEAYRAAEEILSREGIPRVRTEDDDEEAKAWRSLASSTVAKIFGPSAAIEFQKEYDSQIKDVTQPQGGTENLSNVRSPGQPPAKIPAEPGRSSTRARLARRLRVTVTSRRSSWTPSARTGARATRGPVARRAIVDPQIIRSQSAGKNPWIRTRADAATVQA